jgi:hypothetical protein
MSELEMLRLAAKAAGYDINFDGEVNGWYPHVYDDTGDVSAWWNAAKDDGDSRRLQVDLRIALEPKTNHVYAIPWDGCVIAECWSDHDGDKRAATRLVVLRVAAEVGSRL